MNEYLTTPQHKKRIGNCVSEKGKHMKWLAVGHMRYEYHILKISIMISMIFNFVVTLY